MHPTSRNFRLLKTSFKVRSIHTLMEGASKIRTSRTRGVFALSQRRLVRLPPIRKGTSDATPLPTAFSKAKALRRYPIGRGPKQASSAGWQPAAQQLSSQPAESQFWLRLRGCGVQALPGDPRSHGRSPKKRSKREAAKRSSVKRRGPHLAGARPLALCLSCFLSALSLSLLAAAFSEAPRAAAQGRLQRAWPRSHDLSRREGRALVRSLAPGCG